MSRVGKKPIKVPPAVKVTLNADSVEVQGPKGRLVTKLVPGIAVEMSNGELLVRRADDSKRMKALHGLMRALIANSVIGVTDGFKKELDIVGIGYKAEVKGRSVVFNLGYSHPIEFPIPDGITIRVERLNKPIQNYAATVIVSGADKQLVGQVAANIRALREPDPYKGKGIRYAGEVIRLKEGKKGA